MAWGFEKVAANEDWEQSFISSLKLFPAKTLKWLYTHFVLLMGIV